MLVSRDLLVKDRLQVDQQRASPVAALRVFMPVAQPEEYCNNLVAAKRKPKLDEPLSPIPAGGAQRADAAIIHQSNTKNRVRRSIDTRFWVSVSSSLSRYSAMFSMC